MVTGKFINGQAMTNETLKGKIYQKKGFHICELTGEITYESLNYLRDILYQLKDAAPSAAIINVTAITLLTSIGLGEIAKLILWGKSNYCNFGVVCKSNHIAEVLEISGIGDHIPLFPTLNKALDNLPKGK